MTSSVLRRYTPPTCTLEVAAARSALSSWTDRTVLRQVRFDLSFDDPKLADHQQVMVSGDRLQLDALSEAVRTYVQQLLEPDAQQMQPALQYLHPADNGHPIAPLPLHETLLHTTAALSSRPEANTVLAMPTSIYLKPAGLLAHDLHLGPLATAASGEVLRLSATQLFDLANALDDYAAEAVALPAMGRSRWSSPTTGWLKTAAVLVLALGATGGITKFVMDVTQTPNATVATREASTSADATSEALTGSPATDQLFEEEGLNGSLLVPDQANPNAVPPVPPGGVAQVPQPGAFGQPGAVPQSQPQPQLQPQRAPAPLAQAPQYPTGATAAPPAGASIAVAPTPMGRAPMQASPLEQPQNPGVLVPSQGAQLPESGLLRSGEAGSSGTVLPSGDSTSTAAVNPAGIPTRRATGISQLDEANQYFQERWTPPESLNQAIEYRVLVNADGTVQQVLPLGIVAGNYIDRTGMPLMGESFVSPTSNGQPALIRVVLAPNGRVQTFLEEMN